MSAPISRLLAFTALFIGLTGCIGYTCNCTGVGEVALGLYAVEDQPAELPEEDWTQMSVDVGADDVVIDYVDGEGQVWRVTYDIVE